MKITEKEAMSILVGKINYSFGLTKRGSGEPNKALFAAIVLQAIADLYRPLPKPKNTVAHFPCPILLAEVDKASALRYLQGNMPHAQACGISPVYIRRVMCWFGFDVNNASIEHGKVFHPVNSKAWEA